MTTYKFASSVSQKHSLIYKVLLHLKLYLQDDNFRLLTLHPFIINARWQIANGQVTKSILIENYQPSHSSQTKNEENDLNN